MKNYFYYFVYVAVIGSAIAAQIFNYPVWAMTLLIVSGVFLFCTFSFAIFGMFFLNSLTIRELKKVFIRKPSHLMLVVLGLTIPSLGYFIYVLGSMNTFGSVMATITAIVMAVYYVLWFRIQYRLIKG